MHYNSCYHLLGQKLQNSSYISSVPISASSFQHMYMYIYIYMRIYRLLLNTILIIYITLSHPSIELNTSMTISN